MKKQTTKFLKILFALVVVICIVMIALVFKRRSIINEQIKKNEVLLEQLEEVKNKNLQLEKDVQKAKSKESVEKYAREDLNMSKQGEKIYKTLDKKKGD